MTPYWFTKKLPASRHGIENAVRLGFWAAGFGDTYFTCTNPEPPYRCSGLWRSSEPIDLEWVPKDYLILQMKQPNQDVLDAFERVLGHPALAAYRNQAGNVVVEWRVTDGDARYAELKESGVKDLERLS